ncbi:MAG: hypothetical protein V3W34_07560 [Phycisphaerae bacterium]
MAATNKILQTPNERTDRPRGGDPSNRDLSGRVKVYFGVNVASFLLLLGAAVWALYRLFALPWYAWFLILPASGITAALLVERVVSGLTNTVLFAMYRRRDAKALFEHVARLVEEHPNGCNDPLIIGAVRGQLDSSEDPPGVCLILLRSHQITSWPEWALRALPVYIGLGSRSDGWERGIVWKHIEACIPADDRRMIITEWCNRRYVEADLDRAACSFVKHVAPVFERALRQIPAPNPRATVALVAHALSEIELQIKKKWPQIAASIERSRRSLLEKEGILPSSDQEVEIAGIVAQIELTATEIPTFQAAIGGVLVNILRQSKQGRTSEFRASGIADILAVFAIRIGTDQI